MTGKRTTPQKLPKRIKYSPFERLRRGIHRSISGMGTSPFRKRLLLDGFNLDVIGPIIRSAGDLYDQITKEDLMAQLDNVPALELYKKTLEEFKNFDPEEFVIKLKKARSREDEEDEEFECKEEENSAELLAVTKVPYVLEEDNTPRQMIPVEDTKKMDEFSQPIAKDFKNMDVDNLLEFYDDVNSNWEKVLQSFARSQK